MTDLLQASGTANCSEAAVLIFAACNIAGRQGAVHVKGIQATLHHIIWRVVSLTCSCMIPSL